LPYNKDITNEDKMKASEKAYKNLDFLNSREARTVRILSEYLEPEKRFREKGIKHTIVFFGSSRITPDKKSDKLAEYYWAAEEMAFRLATYASEISSDGTSFSICSGGGPGIMEAANRGAVRANSKTIGLNISLPFEQESNPYVTPELGFEFHYFFMRKLWFLYHAKAIIAFPGGFGTLDELFEVLTLVQTRKLEKKDFQILLYDRHFWEALINFHNLRDMGLISPEDLKLFNYFETPDEGMSHLKPWMENIVKNFHLG
jgi:uncharacterized protein (TIGR00730 family)